VPGVVRGVRADLGDRVAAGQILFEVASPEFARARADYLEALAAHVLAEAAMKREEDLFARRVCPEKDVLEARAAHAVAAARERAAADGLRALGLGDADLGQLRDDGEDDRTGAGGEALLPVRAPFAGTVLERDLGLGVAAAPGDRLLLLGDVDEVWVVASVYESDLAALAAARADSRAAGAGLAAELTVAAWPGRVFPGRLDRLGGTLDEATRTAAVRIVAPNPEGLLRPGMFARVRLLLPGAATGLALPQEAVLADEGRSFVFVRATADCFVRRPVTTGRAAGGWIEIASGLRDGQAVVARGAFLLKSDVLRAKMGAGCAD
jgi:cobalt-zinc-cadmium efflux system membrane fusion protein